MVLLLLALCPLLMHTGHATPALSALLSYVTFTAITLTMHLGMLSRGEGSRQDSLINAKLSDPQSLTPRH